MTAQANQQKQRLSLAELAARAQTRQEAGVAAAARTAEARHLTPALIAALEDEARLDPETRVALNELKTSQQAIAIDPHARRAWLRDEILALKGEDEPDPTRVIGLMRMAMKGTLLNGNPALPLFVVKPFNELGRWGPFMVLPNTRMQNGNLVGYGASMFVGVTPEDQIVLQALLSIRAQAARTLVTQLEAEFLVHHLRAAVRPALLLLKGATLVDSKTFTERYVEVSEGLVENRKRCYHFYKLSEEQFFLVEESGVAKRFVAQLAQLAQNQQYFFKDEFDLNDMICGVLKSAQTDDKLITVDQFRRKVPGVLGIQHKNLRVGRNSKRVVSALVIFERRAGGDWRWVIANVEAVDVLFNGRRLAYHEWTSEELPLHLEDFLKGGIEVEPSDACE